MARRRQPAAADVNIRVSLCTLLVSGLCAPSVSGAQSVAHEYRPQVIVTLPRWHGAAVAFVEEQHLATDGLGPVERQHGIILLGPAFRRGAVSLDARELVRESGPVEHRYSPALTSTATLGPQLELRNRTRIQCRDIGGSWSRRYQERVTLARAVNVVGRVLQPYGYGDLSYDSRYGALTRREAGIGVRVPLANHVSIDPSVVHQTDDRRAIPTLIATGLIMRIEL